MFGFCVYAFLMGVIEIFVGMGKNFRVCWYAFYLKVATKKVCQVTLLYTS